MCYEIASRLKINFHKLKLAGVNVESSSIGVYAKTLNCTLMRVPFKYMGIEVGGKPRKKQFSKPILNKLRDKLCVWNERFMSLAGRICLIKSILTVVPLFYLSFFKAPTTIYNSIISIQRRFLWAWGKDKRYIPWFSWDNVCKSLEEGGLGIKDVRLFNSVLLAKWKWRLMSGEQGKCKDILVSKYGLEPGRRGIQVNHQSWWWQDLSKVCGEGEEAG